MTLTIAPNEDDWKAWFLEQKQTQASKNDFYGGAVSIGALAGFFTYLLFVSLIAGILAGLATCVLLASLKPLFFKLELSRFLREVRKSPPEPCIVTIRPNDLYIQTENVTYIFLPSGINEINTGSERYVHLVLEEQYWPIPPSAFANSEQRAQFLDGLQRLKDSSTTKTTCWTNTTSTEAIQERRHLS